MARILAILTAWGMTSATEAAEASKASVDWPAYLGDAASTHYSRLDQIQAKNVSRLKVAWTYRGGWSDPQNRSQIRSFVTPTATFPSRHSNTWYGTMLGCATPAGFGSTPAISDAAVNGDIAASRLSSSVTST